ncbi:unnamed protein product [Phytophthora lilii]|uniref:Unnamed protein product n=1 Tax=Phytophthora lilii TaxID=2077276 RepID=A0A9W7CSY2_9STRA|nr:unnamed protein product [Phytophthora lilii]
MGLLNKAKEALESFASGDSNRNEYDANGSGGAREKVIEFAQKKVAERELEKNDPGYVDKHKSIVKKAVDAAEDFIAKQGEPQRSNPSSSMNSSSYGTDGYSSRYPTDSQNDSDYVREDYSAEKLSYSSRIESDQDGISDSF